MRTSCTVLSWPVLYSGLSGAVFNMNYPFAWCWRTLLVSADHGLSWLLDCNSVVCDWQCWPVSCGLFLRCRTDERCLVYRSDGDPVGHFCGLVNHSTRMIININQLCDQTIGGWLVGLVCNEWGAGDYVAVGAGCNLLYGIFALIVVTNWKNQGHVVCWLVNCDLRLSTRHQSAVVVS